MMALDDRTGAAAVPLPPDGVVLGAHSEGALRAAPIHRYTTARGDLVVAASHHGAGYKPINEDRIALLEQPHQVAAFVVDGMGGHQRGDLAADELCRSMLEVGQLPEDALKAEITSALVERVRRIIQQLPGFNLTDAVRRRLEPPAGTTLDPEAFLDAALAAVQQVSVELEQVDPTSLRQTAEVIRTLANLAPPHPIELGVRRTRERLATYASDGSGSNPPDACFVGVVIDRRRDGSRWLDVRQIGDCKLVVAAADGTIRFETLGESVVPEPDLTNPRVTLPELMAYSLHRNVVANSINSSRGELKRYRRADIPLRLNPGDLLLLYSDGVDDLFAPRELINMLHPEDPVTTFRWLLLASEQRMLYVSRLLREERNRLPPDQRARAYPEVHRRMNQNRIDQGAYVETYSDGTTCRWLKPPKCDNTALCMIRIGDGVT